MKSFLLAATALFAAGAANAAVTVTSAPFDAALAPGEQLVVTFDAPNDPGYALSGAGQLFAASSGNVAAPASNATMFMGVTKGKEAVLNTPALSSLSVYIGSVDSYKSITFEGLGGFSETFTGSQLAATANGNRTSANTNRRFYFDFGTERVTKVTFQSSGNSLEFDNIAANAVPEPATWAMLISGFGLVGFAARRRRQMVQVAA
jgi:hypothetical protein